ncbi:interleukin-6 receptor subunit alpha-like isoform X2 [Heterodontus francisci]
MARVGAQVVIDCGPEGTEGTEWRFNNKVLRPSRRQGVNATRLILNSAQSSDTGNYLCLSNGTKMSAVRLVVQEAPRTPTLNCFLKSYLSPIRCEWHSEELNRFTRCTLSVRSSLQAESSLKRCKFYTGKKVCVCMFPHEEGELDHYYITVAVSNGVGCVASKEKMFTSDGLLKSDPPESVKVKAVSKAPHKLNLTWSYPQTWQRGFYALNFQLTYGILGQELPINTVVVKETSFLIDDALPNKNYSVKVRAKEEFDHGTWSEWSGPAYGMPWADPQRNIIPEDDTEGYPSSPIEYENSEWDENTLQGSHYLEWNSFPHYGPWLVVVSLLTVITLFIVIVIRYKKKWRSQATEKGKAESCKEYLPIRLITVSEARGVAKQAEATAETPLQHLPLDTAFPEDLPHFDVINMGYFYIPQ